MVPQLCTVTSLKVVASSQGHCDVFRATEQCSVFEHRSKSRCEVAHRFNTGLHSVAESDILSLGNGVFSSCSDQKLVCKYQCEKKINVD